MSGAVGMTGGRQDKSDAAVGRFCSFYQLVMALSLEGPAGAFGEFTNDINAVCASIIAVRRFVIRESWTAREKLGCPARVCDWDS